MEILLHLLCSTLPTRLLAYASFLHSLRFGKRAAAVTMFCSQGLELLLAWGAIASGHPEQVRLIKFLFGPVAAAALFLNVRVSFPKLLFFSLFVIDYLMMVVGLSAFLSVRVLHTASRTWQSSMLCLALYLITWIPIYRFFRRCVMRVEHTNAPLLWRIIWLVPALATAIVLTFTGSLDDAVVGTWPFLFARVGLLACILAIYWVLVQALDNLQKQAELEKRLAVETHLLDVQITEQKKRGQLLTENAELLQRQRHDLRHQLTAIQELANTDTEKLQSFLPSLMESIPALPEIFCENEAVNAVVTHYAAVCRRQNTEFSARLTVPANGVPDSDLCVIFGNLLENTAEACVRTEQERRFVSLQSVLHSGVLTVTMDNSCNGAVHEENGRFRSSKRSDFGVGLSSIQAMASAYGGGARFTYDGSVFSSSVYLNL